MNVKRQAFLLILTLSLFAGKVAGQCEIILTSGAGTDAQTVCVNTAITNITYSTTDATGATFSGLPAGVTGAWAGNVVTIIGSPSVTVGSPYGYTVTLTGGGCGAVNATGTITVTVNNTVGAASSTPTLCINTVLTSITHATTGANRYWSISRLTGRINSSMGSQCYYNQWHTDSEWCV
jgi:hypothetical protein